MAIKISELQENTSAIDEDVFPVVSNGETKKVSFETLKSEFANEKIVNDYSNDEDKTYSADYLNKNSPNSKILWTNPNPNNSFSSQSITLSSGDYDILEIYYYDWNATDGFKDLLCQKTIKGHSTKLQTQISAYGNGYAGNRRIRYVSDTTLQVDECYAIIDHSTFNNSQSNYWNVPIYIIGYKTGLFSNGGE